MNVIPLLPWAILCTEALLVKVSATRISLAALVFAIQFLGGHPASCVHLLLACGVVVVLRACLSSPAIVRWVGGALALVFALALGFAIAAAQWLPLLEYAGDSGAAVVRKERLKSAPVIDFAPQYLIGIVFPYANGYPDGVAPFEMRQATKLPNTNELAPGYIGVIPLLLAIVGIARGLRSEDERRRRNVLLLVILGGIATAIAIRFPGVDHIVRLIPGLNVSQNARLLVVAALALAILAGFGLEELRAMLSNGADWESLRKWSLRVAAGIAAVAVLMGLTLLVAKGPIVRSGKTKAEAAYKTTAAHEHSLEYVHGLVKRVHTELLLTSARLLIPAALLAGVWLLVRSRRAANPWPWLVLALVDLLAFAIPFNRGADVSTYLPKVAAIGEMQKQTPARFAGTFRTFIPETSTAYGHSDIRGYDALAPRRYYEWWAHEGIGNMAAERQGYLHRLENPDHAAWALLNFGYLVTAVGQPAPPADKWTRVSESQDMAIYKAKEIHPRAWVVPKAEFAKTLDAVLDRVAKMDSDDADKLVLIDEEGSPKDPETGKIRPEDLTHAASGSYAGSVQFVTTPRRTSEKITPETVRLSVSGGGGWLILADTFFPGWKHSAWTATVITGSYGKQTPIYPAYGVLRAVPIPPGSHIVEFQYRSWSWRIGAFTSIASFCILLLFFGFGIVKDRT
jgi:hypothetical protein